MSNRDETTRDLVSVVVCAYNNWPDLEMTIESALNQSYPEIEVIVVDNSSSDATSEEVPKRFGTRVTYVRQPNRDGGGAYNTGFSLARGEFIQFMDGDDVLAPNKIEKQVAAFAENSDLDIAYGDIRKFQTPCGEAHWLDLKLVPQTDTLGALISDEEFWLDTLGALFRRKIVETVGPWDDALFIDDADYFLRAAWAGCRFGYSPGSPLGFKRIRAGQKTQNIAKMESGLEAVWNKALKYITEEKYRSLLAARFAEHKMRRVIFREQMPRRQALNLLASARSLSPDTFSRMAYAATCAIVLLPFGRSLARLSCMNSARRLFGRLVHFRSTGSPVNEDRLKLTENERSPL
jgi:glycosyltransferase involved in cell wall biosynthesis